MLRKTLAHLAPLGILALLPLGCGQPEPPTPQGPPEPVALRAALHTVPLAEALRETPLDTRTDGVWLVRGPDGASPSGSTTRGDRRRLLKMEGEAAPVALGEVVLDAAGPSGPVGAMPVAGAVPRAAPVMRPVRRGGGGTAGGFSGPAPVATPGVPLKAGSTDDNAEYEAYLEFLATWFDKPGVADRARDVDVRDRRYVTVLDRQGRPVPAAVVTFIDETGDRVAWQGRTFGDGRMMFFPNAIVGDAPDVWRVEVRHSGVLTEVRYAGAGDVHIGIPTEVEAPESVALDVCFVIDTTGSMGDEIERIKSTLLGVTERLKGLAVEFELRYGAVLYRDLTDAYVTKRHPFTGDIEAFAKALRGVRAAGGGDMPESMNQGLAEAVGRMQWREGAAKLCFLVADAPPQMNYKGDVSYDVSMRSALEKGIRIHSVAASGLDAFGSLVMRQVAQFTGGQFLFIEYGANVAASGAAHGVHGAKKSNNLDDIIFERIQDEIAGWGRAPSLDLAAIQLAAPIQE